MPKVTDFDTMSDLCLAAGEAVMQAGSDELKAVMRILLFALGDETARRIKMKSSIMIDTFDGLDLSVSPAPAH